MIDEDAVLERAGAALELRRPDEARRLVLQVIGQSPEHPGALVLLAECSLQEGDFARVHELTRRASAAAPQDLSTLVYCADLARRSEDLDAATFWAEQALQVAPDDVNALNVMTLVQSQRGWGWAAVEHSAAALRQAPASPALLVAHGWACSEDGRPGEATASYLRALEIEPHNLDALNNLAVLRLQCGDLSRASALLSSVLATDPRLEQSRTNLGIVGALARKIVLGQIGLVVAASYVIAWVDGLWGAVAVVLGAALIARIVSRLPGAARRRFWTDVDIRDGFVMLMLALVLASPSWLGYPPRTLPTMLAWLAVSALVLMVPLAIRRGQVRLYLLRNGLRLPSRRRLGSA